MAEYPSLPLFTDAFLADTLHLTSAQVGAYMLMLMAAWRSPDCTLPDDDTYLARVCRMDRRTWRANREVLLSFWSKIVVGTQTKLFQKRLSDERNFVEDKRNKNVAAGKSSALKRKKRHSTDVATERQPKSNQPTPTPNITLSEAKASSSVTQKDDVKHYRFAASVIRLEEKDYLDLKKTYHAIPDFDAELLAADVQYTKEPPGNWFCALGNRLNGRHQHFLARKPQKQSAKEKITGYAVL